MLKVLTLLATTIIATADYFLFQFYPTVAFYVHNLLAFSAGITLAICSYYLLKRKKIIWYYASFIVGFAMITIHIVKIVIGNCF